MKVLDIKVTDWFMNTMDALFVSPMGERLYRIARCTEVAVKTDEGTFRYKFKPGFVTNFRSGGLFVDRFVDQIGDSLQVQVCWLVHDASYTPSEACKGHHPISKAKADELLKAMLLFAGMPSWKASLVYNSVKWFGGSAYEEDDELTASNTWLFKFHWEA